MKYAKSIYGVIVDSADADYKSYVNWMLRCPKCGEPVHLVSSATRREHERHHPRTGELIKVKQADISSSFAHFKGLASEECEDFNKTIDAKYIDTYYAQSRSQRLAIFNSHFLDIIGYERQHQDVYFALFKSVNSINNKLTKRSYDAAVKDYYNFLYHSRDFSDGARKIILDLRKVSLPEMSVKPKFYYQSYYLDFARWLDAVDLDLHILVLQEVFKFLKTSAACKIQKQIFDYSFFRFVNAASDEECKHLLLVRTKTNAQIKEDYNNLLSVMCRRFYQSLTFVDWYGQVQKISAH